MDELRDRLADICQFKRDIYNQVVDFQIDRDMRYQEIAMYIQEPVLLHADDDLWFKALDSGCGHIVNEIEAHLTRRNGVTY